MQHCIVGDPHRLFEVSGHRHPPFFEGGQRRQHSQRCDGKGTRRKPGPQSRSLVGKDVREELGGKVTADNGVAVAQKLERETDVLDGSMTANLGNLRQTSGSAWCPLRAWTSQRFSSLRNPHAPVTVFAIFRFPSFPVKGCSPRWVRSPSSIHLPVCSARASSIGMGNARQQIPLLPH